VSRSPTTARTIVANCALALAGGPAWLRLRRNRHRVQATQRRVLLGILRRAASSEVGQRYAFATIRSVEEYLRRVPVCSYDDLAAQVERIRRGDRGVLTREPVRMLEPTSGSTAATKLIPYTASLQAQFQEAIGAWLFDLYLHRPRLLRGRPYFCVTPLASRQQRADDALPLGFEDDSEYFDPLSALVLRYLLVVPKEVARLQSNENAVYTSLLFLVAARDLSLVSVWSPTFLTGLLKRLPEFAEQMVVDLRSGTLTLGEPEPPELLRALESRLRPDPERSRELRDLAAACDEDQLARLVSRLWPRLSVVSAWADGNAALHVDELTGLLPQSELQPKGLLATEGVVSVPLSRHPEGAALAIGSHFFDFVDDNGEVRLAHQLQPGCSYGVHLTTGGGLYRYRLGDRVQITGLWGQLPLLRFVEREGAVSDWFGEKLNPQHVVEVVGSGLPASSALTACLLALEQEPRPRYVLWTEAVDEGPGCGDLAAHLEAGLRDSHHYDLCRRSGQLGAAEVRPVAVGAVARARDLRAQHEQRRLGAQKPELLDRRDGWAQYLSDRAGHD